MGMEKTIEQPSQPGPEFSPVCSFCAHWDPTKGRHCVAFPSTPIPTQVWNGSSFHLQPIGGEERDVDGRPILFRMHPATTASAIEASNPALAKALRSGWSRN